MFSDHIWVSAESYLNILNMYINVYTREHTPAHNLHIIFRREANLDEPEG